MLPRALLNRPLVQGFQKADYWKKYKFEEKGLLPGQKSSYVPKEIKASTDFSRRLEDYFNNKPAAKPKPIIAEKEEEATTHDHQSSFPMKIADPKRKMMKLRKKQEQDGSEEVELKEEMDMQCKFRISGLPRPISVFSNNYRPR